MSFLKCADSPSSVDMPHLLRVLKWPKIIEVNPVLDITRLVIIKDTFADAIFNSDTVAPEFADVIISHIAECSVTNMSSEAEGLNTGLSACRPLKTELRVKLKLLNSS